MTHGDFEKIQDECLSFDWDTGNQTKSWIKHKVTIKETEEVFFNDPFFVELDTRHSQKEKRYQCLGRTDKNR